MTPRPVAIGLAAVAVAVAAGFVVAAVAAAVVLVGLLRVLAGLLRVLVGLLPRLGRLPLLVLVGLLLVGHVGAVEEDVLVVFRAAGVLVLGDRATVLPAPSSSVPSSPKLLVPEFLASSPVAYPRLDHNVVPLENTLPGVRFQPFL